MGRIAVLLSAFNGEKYIAEQIESLISQDVDGVDIFVRDDGSSDATIDILNGYKGRLFSIEYGKNKGVIGSFLQLLEGAGGGYDYYFFCDQDDVWDRRKLRSAIEMMSSVDQNTPLLYCSRLEYVAENLQHLGYSRLPSFFGLGNALVENIATGCASAINRSARKLLIDHLPATGIAMHDWWFYIVISAFGKVVFDERAFIKYRQHSGNVVGAATNVWSDYIRRFRRLAARKKSGVHAIRSQAIAFLSSYKGMLSEDQKQYVNKLTADPNLLKSRWHLVFETSLKRQRFTDNVFLRLIFLMGLY